MEVAANIMNKQWRIVDKGQCFSMGLGDEVITPHRKYQTSDLAGSCLKTVRAGVAQSV